MPESTPTFLRRKLKPTTSISVLVFFALLGVVAIVIFHTVPYLWMHGEVVMKLTMLASVILAIESIYLGGRTLRSQVLSLIGLIVSALGLYLSNRFSPTASH